MKHPSTFRVGIVFAAIVMMAARAFPQATPSPEPSISATENRAKIERPNSLGFLFVADNFFDGHRPFIQSLRLPTLGGEYGRRLTINWSLHASVRYCFRNHFYALKPPLQIGDITQRSIVFADLSLHRNIFSWNSGSVSAFAGLSLRVGGEFMYVGNFGFEPLTDKYYLLDPGLIGGLRAYKKLPWHFGISLETKYAYYIWTNSHPFLYAFDLPNRPTRNLFAAQVGIHFTF